MKPSEIRMQIRKAEFKGQTSGLALGYAQANLVILAKNYASDFEQFCLLNPKPCPLLEIVKGKFTKKLAQNANIYTDIPKYFIYEKGQKRAEAFDVSSYYNDDLVGFLLGCSFSFEQALLENGLELRHITLKRNVSMYKTNIQCKSVGVFKGEMVVSMRVFTPENAKKAQKITAAFDLVHGAPVHIGNPLKIGIKDIFKPDFGDEPVIKDGEVPVFWACGVSPQNIIMQAKLPFAITHAPGCMFISDILNKDLHQLKNSLCM